MRGIQSGNQNNPSSVALAANALRHQQHQNSAAAETTKSGSGDIAGAQDTIYLCNFRVSVDGDWLCLKELQDDGSGSGGNTQLPPEGGSNKSQNSSSSSCGQIHNNNHNNSNTAAAVHAHNDKNAYNNRESCKDKCVDEKIVERDWVNYYCRSHVFFFFSLIFFSF